MLASHSELCLSFWHHSLKSAAIQILEYFQIQDHDLLLPRNKMAILWAWGKRNWSIMFYCNLNIYRSIANESHLSNFRNNNQRKTSVILNCSILAFQILVFPESTQHFQTTSHGRIHMVERSVLAILVERGHQGPTSEYVVYACFYSFVFSLFRGTNTYVFL